jgi:tRNA(Ile)-lysidine synthase
MDLDRHIAERIEQSVPDGESICVALSGGLDSVVLLDLVARAAGRRAIAVSAVHVHHGLSPNADAWADFCRESCSARGVPLDVERVRVERASPGGLEAAARAARYAVFASRREDWVALAHHHDDQAETVLLQLLRGTGLKGVAGMPEVRELAGAHARLWRPLLDVPRAALKAHAQARALRWIEDESNAAQRHDRNFIRHEIARRLEERLPRWRDALARFSRHAAAADELLADLARLDGLPQTAGTDLAIDEKLGAARRANLLRAYLDLHALAMPSEARLAEMARQLFGARGDARVRIEHDGASLVRFRDRIRIERLPGERGAWHRQWHGESEVALGGHGAIRFERATGEGLSAARAAEPGWHFAGRAGGERMRLDPRRPTRTLKNLLREHAIAPWERERLPLLFHRDRLVWAPGIGIEADYACPPGEPGLRAVWVRDGSRNEPATAGCDKIKS